MIQLSKNPFKYFYFGSTFFSILNFKYYPSSGAYFPLSMPQIRKKIYLLCCINLLFVSEIYEYFLRFVKVNKFSFLFQLIFVALSLFKWNEPILSQTAVGVAGVLLVAITNAAALGFCAVFGIPFNASSTQVSFLFLLEE